MKERTFEFAIDIILLLKSAPYKKENDMVPYQLAKSGTLASVNYEESQVTNFHVEFRHKIGIALREARELAEFKSILGAIYTKVSK